MSVRTMYDAIDPTAIPASAGIVAGYTDGMYANMPAMAARFPHAIRVPIAVFASSNSGTVLDVETGDASPDQAPGWVLMRRRAGVDPSVYCNSSTWPAVRAAFHAAGVAEPHYWIAQYDGDPTIPAGAVAKQYLSTTGWDESSVAAHWPGVDPSTPTPEPDMPLTAADVQMILTTKIPEAKLADGYIPTVQDCLNGAKLADTLLTSQTAQVAALSAAVAALVKDGGITAAEVTAAAQAGAAAALAQLGHALTPPAA
jgi:hypothetical protein